jgi:hypothetical protein
MAGKIDVELHYTKLRGAFTLARTGNFLLHVFR